MALTDKQLADGEEVVLDLRTHWKTLLAPIALLIFLIGVVWLAWWLARDSDWSMWVLVIVGALALIAACAFVLIPIWRWNSSRFTITTRRVSHRSGLLTKRGRDIPLYRVNDVAIEKGPIDRLLGCGTLIISDATDKAGMELRDVPGVESVQVTLQNLLFQQDDGSDDGEFPPTQPRRPRGR